MTVLIGTVVVVVTIKDASNPLLDGRVGHLCTLCMRHVSGAAAEDCSVIVLGRVPNVSAAIRSDSDERSSQPYITTSQNNPDTIPAASRMHIPTRFMER